MMVLVGKEAVLVTAEGASQAVCVCVRAARAVAAPALLPAPSCLRLAVELPRAAFVENGGISMPGRFMASNI